MAKILIVDDSSTMRKIVGRALRQAGFEFEQTLEAADGKLALEVLKETPVDIILSDINMPNMTGVEFLQAKNEDPAIQGIPVVMISTETGSDILAQAIELGAKGSIKKPFTPDLIKEVLGKIL